MHKVVIQVLLLWTVSTALPAMQECCDLSADETSSHHAPAQASEDSHHHATKPDVETSNHLASAGHGHDTDASHHSPLEPCESDNEVSSFTIKVEPVKIDQPAINSTVHLVEKITFNSEYFLHHHHDRELYLLTSRLRI